MKKIAVLVVAMLYLTVNANSQIEKGNWLVGGNASFSSNKSTAEYYRNTNIEVAPNIGYLIWDKFSAGLRVAFAYDKQSYNIATYHYNVTKILAGPFVRYYFLQTDKLINLFVEGNYSYGSNKVSGVYTVSKGPVSKYGILAGPVLYFNSSVGLEFTVGYSNTRHINAKASTSGFQMGLGLQIHLQK